MSSHLHKRLGDECNSADRRVHLKSPHSTKSGNFAALNPDPIGSQQRTPLRTTDRSSRVPFRLLVKRVLFVIFGISYIVSSIVLLVAVFLSFVPIEPQPEDLSNPPHLPTPTRSSEKARRTLTFSRKIDVSALEDLNSTIVGMTGEKSKHRLVFADTGSNMAHVLDLTKEPPRDRTNYLPTDIVFNEFGKGLIRDVAYNAKWNALFIATLQPHSSGFHVRSYTNEQNFSHKIITNGWTFWNSKPFELLFAENENISQESNLELKKQVRIQLRLLHDGRLFIGQWDSNEIHVCRVQTDLSINDCEHVTLPDKHRGFDVQLVDNETWLVAALQNGNVPLFRLSVDNSAVQLSEVTLHNAMMPLFCGNILLVGVSVSNARGFAQDVQSFCIGKGRPQYRDCKRFALNKPFEISSWCFVNETLFVWDNKSRHLLLYIATDAI